MPKARSGFVIICGMFLVMVACKREPVLPAIMVEPPSTVQLHGTTNATPVSAYDLCIGAERPVSGGTVQLFLDASGSMSGFSIPRIMDPLSRWIKRTANGAAAPGAELQLARVQAFSSLGLIDLPIHDLAVNYEVTHGDTPLDLIVQRAADADVTAIVTDGVPYTEASQSADCMGQVDVTCLGKRLRNFINSNHHPGMWIVPVLALYDGKFTTEGQKVPEDAEWASRTVDHLKTVLGGEIQIRANTGDDREVNPFFYTGPRMLLVIILAKDVGLGRVFLSSLYQNAQLYNVTRLGDDFTGANTSAGAVRAMTPIELYPGYTPLVKRIRASKPPKPLQGQADRPAGFIDIPVITPRNPLRIAVGCAGARQETATEVLNLDFETDGAGDCQKIYSLPSVQFMPELEAKVTDEDRLSLSGMVKSVELSLDSSAKGSADKPAVATGALSGKIEIHCSGESGKPCATPGLVRVVARVSYADAAEQLGKRDPQGRPVGVGAVAYLQKLSTDKLTDEPFKVLALDRMLVEFLRTVTQDAAARDVGTVEICRTDLHTPAPPARATQP